MAPPWQETQTKVVIEFRRGGGVGSRIITFNHRPDVLPTQLHGRVQPHVWAALMTDCMELAKTHPYTAKPSAGRCLSWVGGFCMTMAVGFCCVNPDGGDYAVWLPQVNAVLDRHRPAFSQAGCDLSLQQVHGSMWVQVDVDEKAMAVGQPVVAPPAGPYTPTPTGPYAPAPTGPYAPTPTGPYSPTPTGPYQPSPTPGPYPAPSPAPGYTPHPDPAYPVPPPSGYAGPPVNAPYAPPPATTYN